MSDEQARTMIDLLTEIRDELRLVRISVGDTDSSYRLEQRLRAAGSQYNEMRDRMKMMSLPIEEIQAALQTADQRL